MKLAVLTHYITSYRISTFVELAKKVDHLTLVLSSDLSDPKLHETGIDVQILPSVLIPRRRRHPSGFVETYKVHVPYGVGRALGRIDPDAIHAHEFGMRTIAATFWKRRTGRPMVIHADLSEQTEQGRGGIRPALRKAILKQTDRVAVNGESGASYIRGLGFASDRIDTLPFATDVSVFSAVKPLWRRDGVRRLLYVGRLIELKGLEEFIEVAGAYLSTRPDIQVELTLVGDGDRANLIEAVPRPANFVLKMPGAVQYTKLGEIYAQADCFVFPTLGDTWGMVVNESMAAGLPVMGSVLGQASVELITEGESGWLFDPRSRDSMKGALQRFLETPDERLPEMGERARTGALAISPDNVAQRFVDSCQMAIEAKGRS